MTEEPSLNLEMWVLAKIRGAFKSHELLEAERPEGAPPYDEAGAMLQNWAALVDRQGRILAHLAVIPATREELVESMPGLMGRAPALLEAHFQGDQPMTWELFSRAAAQTVAVHRREIERVVAEQVSDPEEIEEVLADAPIPTGTEDEDRSDLMDGVWQVLGAHMKALVKIAYDLEQQFGRFEVSDEGI